MIECSIKSLGCENWGLKTDKHLFTIQTHLLIYFSVKKIVFFHMYFKYTLKSFKHFYIFQIICELVIEYLSNYFNHFCLVKEMLYFIFFNVLCVCVCRIPSTWRSHVVEKTVREVSGTPPHYSNYTGYPTFFMSSDWISVRILGVSF